MNKTELLIHPLRLRILQHLSVYKEATTNEIISVLPEVSKASVYNHIKLLESNHIIQVVHENRIRGTVEKTYALHKAEKNNDFSGIVTFLLSLLWDFQKYYSDQNRNPSEDMLFAGRDYLLLTDEEFRQFTDEYERLCRKYMEKKSADAKPRNISIISSPVIEEGIPERHVKKNEKIL